MSIGYATTVRTNRMTQVLNAMDAGTGAALIRYYDGVRPSTGGTATTLLAELTCTDPVGTVTNGVLTFSAITKDPSANNSGNVAWFRIVDSDINFVLDGSVTEVGGGGDIEVVSTTIVAGAEVSLISAVLTDGSS